MVWEVWFMKHFCHQWKHVVLEKRTFAIVWIRTLFLEHHFSLKEWLTDKPWMFKFGYLADIFFQSKQRENATFKKTTGGILLMSKSEISSKN